MSVVTIRSHSRYAVRAPMELWRDGSLVACGLLIELSAHGCRISQIEHAGALLKQGEQVTIVSPEGIVLHATIRWAHESVVGLRLDPPLGFRRMQELLDTLRSRAEARVTTARSAA